MAWLILLAAAVLEVTWALALKESDGFSRAVPAAIGVVTAIGSLRCSCSPSATSRWAPPTRSDRLGAVGVALLGIVLFGESASPERLACWPSSSPASRGSGSSSDLGASCRAARGHAGQDVDRDPPAASAVMPATSNGGQTSTTSAAHRSSSAADAAQRAAQLARRQPARLGRPRAGRERRVEHVDVDREVDALRPAARRGRRVVERRARARACRSRPSCASGSPAARIQSKSSGPGQVPRSPICTMLSPRRWPSSTATRNGVPWEIRTPYSSAPVSAWVSKWTTAYPSRAERLAEHAQRRQRERVVAAEHERHRARRRAPRAARRPRCSWLRGRSPGATAHVAVVDDVEDGERVEPEARCGRPACPPSSAARIARGPKRAPGRFDVPSSNGAPTTATSTPSSAAGAMTSRLPANVCPMPTWLGASPRTPSCSSAVHARDPTA